MKLTFTVEAEIDGDEIPVMLFAEGRDDGTPKPEELIGNWMAVKSGHWENMIWGEITAVTIDHVEQTIPRKAR